MWVVPVFISPQVGVAVPIINVIRRQVKRPAIEARGIFVFWQVTSTAEPIAKRVLHIGVDWVICDGVILVTLQLPV